MRSSEFNKYHNLDIVARLEYIESLLAGIPTPEEIIRFTALITEIEPKLKEYPTRTESEYIKGKWDFAQPPTYQGKPFLTEFSTDVYKWKELPTVDITTSVMSPGERQPIIKKYFDQETNRIINNTLPYDSKNKTIKEAPDFQNGLKVKGKEIDIYSWEQLPTYVGTGFPTPDSDFSGVLYGHLRRVSENLRASSIQYSDPVNHTVTETPNFANGIKVRGAEVTPGGGGGGGGGESVGYNWQKLPVLVDKAKYVPEQYNAVVKEYLDQRLKKYVAYDGDKEHDVKETPNFVNGIKIKGQTPGALDIYSWQKLPGLIKGQEGEYAKPGDYNAIVKKYADERYVAYGAERKEDKFRPITGKFDFVDGMLIGGVDPLKAIELKPDGSSSISDTIWKYLPTALSLLTLGGLLTIGGIRLFRSSQGAPQPVDTRDLRYVHPTFWNNAGQELLQYTIFNELDKKYEKWGHGTLTGEYYSRDHQKLFKIVGLEMAHGGQANRSYEHFELHVGASCLERAGLMPEELNNLVHRHLTPLKFIWPGRSDEAAQQWEPSLLIGYEYLKDTPLDVPLMEEFNAMCYEVFKKVDHENPKGTHHYGYAREMMFGADMSTYYDATKEHPIQHGDISVKSFLGYRLTEPYDEPKTDEQITALASMQKYTDGIAMYFTDPTIPGQKKDEPYSRHWGLLTTCDFNVCEIAREPLDDSGAEYEGWVGNYAECVRYMDDMPSHDKELNSLYRTSLGEYYYEFTKEEADDEYDEEYRGKKVQAWNMHQRYGKLDYKDSCINTHYVADFGYYENSLIHAHHKKDRTHYGSNLVQKIYIGRFFQKIEPSVEDADPDVERYLMHSYTSFIRVDGSTSTRAGIYIDEVQIGAYPILRKYDDRAYKKLFAFDFSKGKSDRALSLLNCLKHGDKDLAKNYVQGFNVKNRPGLKSLSESNDDEEIIKEMDWEITAFNNVGEFVPYLFTGNYDSIKRVMTYDLLPDPCNNKTPILTAYVVDKDVCSLDDTSQVKINSGKLEIPLGTTLRVGAEFPPPYGDPKKVPIKEVVPGATIRALANDVYGGLDEQHNDIKNLRNFLVEKDESDESEKKESFTDMQAGMIEVYDSINGYGDPNASWGWVSNKSATVELPNGATKKVPAFVTSFNKYVDSLVNPKKHKQVSAIPTEVTYQGQPDGGVSLTNGVRVSNSQVVGPVVAGTKVVNLVIKLAKAVFQALPKMAFNANAEPFYEIKTQADVYITKNRVSDVDANDDTNATFTVEATSTFYLDEQEFKVVRRRSTTNDTVELFKVSAQTVSDNEGNLVENNVTTIPSVLMVTNEKQNIYDPATAEYKAATQKFVKENSLRRVNLCSNDLLTEEPVFVKDVMSDGKEHYFIIVKDDKGIIHGINEPKYLDELLNKLNQ